MIRKLLIFETFIMLNKPTPRVARRLPFVNYMEDEKTNEGTSLAHFCKAIVTKNKDTNKRRIQRTNEKKY